MLHQGNVPWCHFARHTNPPDSSFEKTCTYHRYLLPVVAREKAKLFFSKHPVYKVCLHTWYAMVFSIKILLVRIWASQWYISFSFSFCSTLIKKVPVKIDVYFLNIPCLFFINFWLILWVTFSWNWWQQILFRLFKEYSWHLIYLQSWLKIGLIENLENNRFFFWMTEILCSRPENVPRVPRLLVQALKASLSFSTHMHEW